MATAASPCNLFLGGDTTNHANVLNMPSQCSVQITPSQYKQTPLACPLNGCCSSKLFIAQTSDAGAAADFEGSKI